MVVVVGVVAGGWLVDVGDWLLLLSLLLFLLLEVVI